jgi:hypothetical protein
MGLWDWGLILRQDPRGIDERALSLRPKCKTTADLGGSTVESYSSYQVYSGFWECQEKS